ncbi:MAG: GMC family oxidoreductase [Magnetospirillum sp.]|nr:GMC family oxidoreductase [Magnetospirillum sp.]
MLLDARELPPDYRLMCDIAIVGAGPAGIALALRLTGSGLSVVLLEAGGHGGRPDLDPFHGRVEDPLRHPPVTLYRSRGLGGTSAMWGGRCVPFDPIDFEPRPHVPFSGWPIGWDEVAPWYAHALALCEAGRPAFRVEAALGDAAPPTIPGFSAADVEVDGIERFSCPTHFGRRYGAQLAGADDVTVVLRASCTGIERTASGRAVTGLAMASAPGRHFRVEARSCVLAAGGLETTRLLLASRIGEERGLVGRFYMCHVEGKAALARFHPGAKVVFGYERDGDGVYLRRVVSFPAEAQRRLGMTNLILRFEPPPIPDPSHGSAVLSALYLSHTLLRPEYRRKVAEFDYRAGAAPIKRPLLRHLANLARGLPELAGFGLEWTRRHWLAQRKLPYVAVARKDGALDLDFNAEQSPNPDSRVTLSDEVDAFGLPRLQVDWRASAIDVDSVVTAHRLLATRLAESGTGSLEVDEERIREGYKAMGSHHIGTARMAADPSAGVVDRDCRVFGLDNLYLAGSAVFPTSSHANPTLTIVALAVRLAEHLRRRPTSGAIEVQAMAAE